MIENNTAPETPAKQMTISGKALAEIISFITGENPPEMDEESTETEVTIREMDAWTCGETETKNPAGLYVEFAEYPEEGLYGPLGQPRPARGKAGEA